MGEVENESGKAVGFLHTGKPTEIRYVPHPNPMHLYQST